jgi:hypothetical protein
MATLSWRNSIMSKPTTRTEFKEYCLRALGKPVINIDVSDDQVDDRVDEALRYYADYHFDGSDKIYFKYQITDEDKANKYITLPENILGAVRIFPFGFYSSAQSSMFNVTYQIALNDLYTLTSYDMVPFYMMMQHLNVLQELLVGEKPIRFNRHKNRLYIDMNWDLQVVGQYLIVECYEVVDPEVYTDAWADRWLFEYCAALIKRQWGNNTKKFGNMELPGGIKFNGQKIYDEADQQIKDMRAEMISSYSLPITDMIG